MADGATTYLPKKVSALCVMLLINHIQNIPFVSALDQLITQMMENANSNRPVPATQEIMDDLPREVLEEGSAYL